VTVKKIHKKN